MANSGTVPPQLLLSRVVSRREYTPSRPSAGHILLWHIALLDGLVPPRGGARPLALCASPDNDRRPAGRLGGGRRRRHPLRVRSGHEVTRPAGPMGGSPLPPAQAGGRGPAAAGAPPPPPPRPQEGRSGGGAGRMLKTRSNPSRCRDPRTRRPCRPARRHPCRRGESGGGIAGGLPSEVPPLLILLSMPFYFDRVVLSLFVPLTAGFRPAGIASMERRYTMNEPMKCHQCQKVTEGIELSPGAISAICPECWAELQAGAKSMATADAKHATHAVHARKRK